MKAVVLSALNTPLSLEDIPTPSPQAGEVLVRVAACGVCHTDLHVIKGEVQFPLPCVLGHEISGVVEAVAADVKTAQPGDAVVCSFIMPCGTCHYCRRGSESMCRAFKASNLDPGGFAEYVRVPAPNVRAATFRIPSHVSDEAASFVEPLACCLRAVGRARVEPRDNAVVVGLGSIGCLFVQLLRRAGASVVGVDPLGDRADLAKRLGADAAGACDAARARVSELSGNRGADLVLVTGGGADVLPLAAELARDGGAIHYFAGGGGDRLPLPLETLYHRELTVTATYSSSPATLAEAFRLIVDGEVTVDRLITHRLPLGRLAEGVDLMRRHEALKVYVTP